MHLIDDLETARAVLNDVTFVVTPALPATSGIAWLRATVGRFTNGEAHERRRATQIAILAEIPPETLRNNDPPHPPHPAHPVETLARAMGVTGPIVDLVRAAAQAYQPETGDESRADVAVSALVQVFGGAHDEATAPWPKRRGSGGPGARSQNQRVPPGEYRSGTRPYLVV
ncbi:hypothetical protein [Actinoplanes derwentensis]|uniref:hypothetical protein n=1 Tax=Actinoplanes derwentensis TaxID=113562 RepID=UPI000B8A4AA0|nr:hypothetical protein [Actinoplanes derwentensis]GID81102.1 hypothetical protein Ade03nite_00260 [Actinoplanes derwentensis]